MPTTIEEFSSYLESLPSPWERYTVTPDPVPVDEIERFEREVGRKLHPQHAELLIRSGGICILLPPLLVKQKPLAIVDLRETTQGFLTPALGPELEWGVDLRELIGLLDRKWYTDANGQERLDTTARDRGLVPVVRSLLGTDHLYCSDSEGRLVIWEEGIDDLEEVPGDLYELVIRETRLLASQI